MRGLILPAVLVLLSAGSACDQRMTGPSAPPEASARAAELAHTSASVFTIRSVSFYRPSPAESTLIERLANTFPPGFRDQIRASFMPRGSAQLVGVQFTNNPTAQALADSIFMMRRRQALAGMHGDRLPLNRH